MVEIKELKVELETKSPFRVGAKKSFAGIDQPIVKIGGRIVVPGTSLKGALRQEIEIFDREIFKQSRNEALHSSKQSIEGRGGVIT